MFYAVFSPLTGLLAKALPLLMLLVATLIGVVPLNLPWVDDAVAVPWLLLLVYFWAVYRPDLIPAIAVFAIGLLWDMLSYGPLGLWAFNLVMLRWAAMELRRPLAAPFARLWGGLILAASCASLLQWGILAVMNGQLPAILPAVMQVAVAALLFPLLAWPLISLSRRLPD